MNKDINKNNSLVVINNNAQSITKSEPRNLTINNIKVENSLSILDNNKIVSKINDSKIDNYKIDEDDFEGSIESILNIKESKIYKNADQRIDDNIYLFKNNNSNSNVTLRNTETIIL